MTSHVNLEATGFVVHLVTAWVGTWELACFSEVSPIVREEGTEGDEGFLTACTEEDSICEVKYSAFLLYF